MKKTALTTFMLLALAVGAFAQNSKPAVVPELREWKGGKGAFVPGADISIVYSDESLRPVCEQFAADWKILFGESQELNVRAGKASEGDFFFGLGKASALGEEGYGIDINKNVRVSAASAKGALWASRTLLQICCQSADRHIPRGVAKDSPDYALRGFMLDCGRKFIPMSYLRDLIKVMSFYKMNTLQLHLNDNGFCKYFGNDWNTTYSAFRLECDTYPGLTARDGSYSKKEFRELQDEAARLGINVIPEIDAPAHALCFTQYRPELGSEKFGYDHLDLSNPDVIPFMDALWKEYLEGDEPVFAGPDVHIGTDEYSNETPDVVAQFREFTDHFIRYVESWGKNAFAWGALTHADGPTPVKSEGVTLSEWSNGYCDPVRMKELGYKIVSIPDVQVYIVPLAWYYHDYLDIENLYQVWTPANLAHDTFDYALGVKFQEHDPAIAGGMFAVWNDHVGNGVSVKDIHHRTYPALQVMAAKSWNIAPTASFEEYAELCHALPEAPGVNQLGRIGDGPGVVYEADELQPGAVLPFEEIGYGAASMHNCWGMDSWKTDGYEICFELEAAEEALGTELFRSDNAVFYLSDPISGKLGYARDGYLYSYNFAPRAGEKLHIRIVGDNRGTELYVNGRLADKKAMEECRYNEGKDTFRKVATLVFPLRHAGHFRSRISKLQVVRKS